jgi:uncharacterized damage-inducible protein DinB
MLKFFADYIDRLERCHNDILKALEGLSPAALDWVPGPQMNSISVLLFHLTGAERFWIGDIALQDPSNRDREAEFKVVNVGTDALNKRLTDNVEYARTALDKFSLQDLEIVRTVPRDGNEYSVAWALLHALEHSAIHLGQIQLTRQLWEQRQNRVA